MRVVGVNSGTSVDGISVAVVEITQEDEARAPSIHLLCETTVPFPKDDRDRILQSMGPSCNARQLCMLNFRIGHLFAEAILKVLSDNHIDPSSIDAVGSHGQTMWHEVNRETGLVDSSLQIGEGSVIAERLGCDVVCDFRVADVAAGGQGAPLMSMFDELILRPQLGPTHWRAVQNIGGIGNVTFLPPASAADTYPIIAFDTGPGNSLMDTVISIATEGKLTYDNNGELASNGTLNTSLFEELTQNPYFSQKPPKTTGRELFGTEEAKRIWTEAQQRGLSLEDTLRTLSEVTAWAIDEAYRDFWPVSPYAKEKSEEQHVLAEVLVSGGGAWNTFLMERISDRLKSSFGSQVQVKQASHLDAKECMLFALLAYLRLKGIKSNVPSATGAKGKRLLGKICAGNR